MSFALLNLLKYNTSLNRIQSLKVLSALFFNNSNIDLVIEKFDNIEADNEYVYLEKLVLLHLI